MNSLSGSHLKVGNFPGVTVEKSEAKFNYKNYEIKIIDLPGTYSINDYSLEERITKEFYR
ncbi:FeoB small GTPase domain-containing protein [Campylobacter sp. CX2-4080-23]|uniref:FeoB small GTPase domain-containing protein n=1 Tax=Campylobacter porcelli TaxID=1660073 RepID=UPI002E9DCCE4|nr:FeoB small GTPase domain-containing protein [Campylobacter sp. CX2-4080-23]